MIQEKSQQPRSFRCPDFVINALKIIESSLRETHLRNNTQWVNPFDNTGSDFKNKLMHVVAYDWSNNYQLFNFKYKDIEIKWHKNIDGCETINRIVSHEEIGEMVYKCAKSLSRR